MSKMQVQEVSIENLVLNPVNPSTRTPNKELIQSIKAEGILTPLLVMPNGKLGNYFVIAGERRLKAAKELGLKTVPVIVQEVDHEKGNSLLLVDNIHRQNMNMYEEYLVVNELLKNSNVADVASRLNKSAKWVTRRASLENLIPEMVTAIQENAVGLTERIVFVFARLPHTIQKALYKQYANDKIQIDGKSITSFRVAEVVIEDAASRMIQRGMFDGTLKPADLLQLYRDPEAIGRKTAEAVSKDLFSEKETQTLVVENEETLKRVKEIMKEVKGMPRLSTSRFTPDNETIPSDQYRKATKDDDEKDIQEGVFVTGDKAGTFLRFVRVKAQQAEKKEDTRTEAQKEKARKERLEKVLMNRSLAAANQALFDLIYTKKLKYSPNVNKFIVKKTPSNILRRILRAMMTEEEFEKVTFENVTAQATKRLEQLSPDTLLALLYIGSNIEGEQELISSFYETKFSQILAGERKEVDRQYAADQKKKEEARLAKSKK